MKMMMCLIRQNLKKFILTIARSTKINSKANSFVELALYLKYNYSGFFRDSKY
jgi:hypothetical protein